MKESISIETPVAALLKVNYPAPVELSPILLVSKVIVCIVKSNVDEGLPSEVISY